MNERYAIEINGLDNDSFADGNAGLETAKILRELADRLERDGLNAAPIVLRDTNGNKVGSAGLTVD